MRNPRIKELFKLWQKLENYKKTYYIVENWGITPKHRKVEPLEAIEWQQVQQIFDDAVLEIENEDKPSEENNSD